MAARIRQRRQDWRNSRLTGNGPAMAQTQAYAPADRLGNDSRDAKTVAQDGAQ